MQTQKIYRGDIDWQALNREEFIMNFQSYYAMCIKACQQISLWTMRKNLDFVT